LQCPAGTDIAAILEEVDVRGIRPSRHVGSLLKQRTDDLDMEIIIRKFVDVSEDDVTTSWEAGTRVRTPVGDIGVVVVTSTGHTFTPIPANRVSPPSTFWSKTPVRC